MLPPITQEDRDNILIMHQRGLKEDNIAAIMGIPQKTVSAFLVGIGVIRQRKQVELRPLSLERRQRQPEIKSEITWVHPESIGLDENWETKGSCRNNEYHPDLWFPSPNETFTIQLALKICSTCPVIVECRATSLARGERNGVWGGLTEDQRMKVLKDQRRAERRSTLAQNERETSAQ
jgi:WhiB family redox-sensing transcriptional regulator